MSRQLIRTSPERSADGESTWAFFWVTCLPLAGQAKVVSWPAGVKKKKRGRIFLTRLCRRVILRGVPKPEAERRTEKVNVALTQTEKAHVDKRRAEMTPGSPDLISPGGFLLHLLHLDMDRPKARRA